MTYYKKGDCVIHCYKKNERFYGIVYAYLKPYDISNKHNCIFNFNLQRIYL